ncbi:flagellar hook-length control protein FliK [Salinicola socius]|uniref:Flagellar hook-length control protein-like C-terminal domain-containing protein n=1 Tax=Salinicola socius TaxID=404433 RepID=A0A1Q8SPC6_9GAMM|nr:flagellar hook-length control protein FliK [Salinicola socius]OLO03295.1 hypothetical protein BTW07_14515 [Salinicola socius]
MSGITPILDTLLHQVLGKRVDLPAVRDQPLPVSAASSSDAVQPAHSDSRLNQQGGERIGAATFGVGRQGVFSPPPVSGSGAASIQLHLSHAATDIADILSRFPATQTASIRPMLSLLVQSGGGADSLATALSQSVRESGVFYESHLQRWMSGQYPRASLMREPQAWLSLTFRPSTPTSLLSNPGFPLWIDGRTAPRSGSAPGTAGGAPGGLGAIASPTSRAAETAGPMPAGRLSSSVPSSASAGSGVDGRAQAMMGAAEEQPFSMTRAHQLSQSSSESLQSLVRHQLDLIAAPNLRWEGQVWPGVPMTMLLTELPVDRRFDDGSESAFDRPEREGESHGGDWRAEVQLRLPSLGVIDIVFLARGESPLQVEVNPADEAARAQLRQELTPLRERLAPLGANVELAEGVAAHE